MSGAIIDMQSQEWNTPDHIVEAVRNFYYGMIGLDPCDNDFSTTHAIHSYKLPEKDGLIAPWHGLGSVYVNPPYGRTVLSPANEIVNPVEYRTYTAKQKEGHKVTSIEDWIARAHCTWNTHKSPVILLIPAATETSFWFKYIWGEATAICFVKGRLSHPVNGEIVAATTKPSALVYYGDDLPRFKEYFRDLGWVVATGV